MAVNRDKPDRWKKDIALSVDLYNDWFLKFAPKAFRETRVETTKEVEASLKATDNLTNIRPEVLRREPGVLASLRMSTCPPIAKDRLVGLTRVPKSMVVRMEEGKLPVRLKHEQLDAELVKIGKIIVPFGEWEKNPRLSGEDFSRPAGPDSGSIRFKRSLAVRLTNPLA